tara:strand:- start:209 stop:481 length:273 start_codon:yes stop_codon:yes gene_type:complete
MELYDIYVQGVKEFSSIGEEEMLDITQALADEFYNSGYPHPDEIEIKYLGNRRPGFRLTIRRRSILKDPSFEKGLFLSLNRTKYTEIASS